MKGSEEDAGFLIGLKSVRNMQEVARQAGRASAKTRAATEELGIRLYQIAASQDLPAVGDQSEGSNDIKEVGKMFDKKTLLPPS